MKTVVLNRSTLVSGLKVRPTFPKYHLPIPKRKDKKRFPGFLESLSVRFSSSLRNELNRSLLAIPLFSSTALSASDASWVNSFSPSRRRRSSSSVFAPYNSTNFSYCMAEGRLLDQDLMDKRIVHRSKSTHPDRLWSVARLELAVISAQELAQALLPASPRCRHILPTGRYRASQQSENRSA